MLEALAGCAGLGMLLSLRYRLPAAIAVSAILLAAGAPIGQFAGLPLWTALAAAGAAVIVLQGGYLAGLLLACGAARVRLWPSKVRPPASPP